MRSRFLLIGLFVLTFVSCVQAAEGSKEKTGPPVMVADQFYWAGPEGNLGISFGAKFRSAEKMAETFNLLGEIGVFTGKHPAAVPERVWFLHDILVSVDFNANGYVATWRVSGPRPLLQRYLDNLRKEYKEGSAFYDFDYTFIDFKPTAYWERER